MARILYYLVIKPLSLLPLSVLYLLSDLLYGLSLLGFAYRKKVVRSNMKMAFPTKSQEERQSLENKFYLYFYDLLCESIRLFSISEREALQRFKVVNAEVLYELVTENQSALLVGGHYTNWELFAVATDPQITHKLLGIYTPLTNAFMEMKFSQSRSRFGLELVPKRKIKETLDASIDQLTLTTFAIDQSPRKDQKAYWMEFLGNETAVHFGAERYAKDYNYPVVYGQSKRVKRGHYELTLEIISANPTSTEFGEITKKATNRLERQVLEKPEYWLWTHKRWKLKPPQETQSDSK